MTIQLAFITGVEVLDLTTKGDMEMALAHLVLQDDAYAAHYKRQADLGRFVILDNGAFEMQDKGRGLSAADVLDAAERINATELVCSDVLYDGLATVEASEEFIAAAQARKPGHYQFMGVVQGRDRNDFRQCYEGLTRMRGITSIGLSKLAVPVSFPQEYLASSRPQAIAFLDALHIGESSGLGAPKPIHLLGGDASLPQELFLHRQANRRRVRSEDSSFAYWYGYHHVTIDRDLHATKNVPGPIDFYASVSSSQRSLMTHHMDKLLASARS